MVASLCARPGTYYAKWADLRFSACREPRRCRRVGAPLHAESPFRRVAALPLDDIAAVLGKPKIEGRPIWRSRFQDVRKAKRPCVDRQFFQGPHRVAARVSGVVPGTVV